MVLVTDSHNKLLLEDKVEYSLSEIKKSKIKPENKFRNYFVDNYLRKNSHLLNFSSTDEFTFFDKESEETSEITARVSL